MPGNHDEPAGTDNLSAVDILAACNLVNYYGKLVRSAGEGSAVSMLSSLMCADRVSPSTARSE